MYAKTLYTGRSNLKSDFLEHENQSGVSVIWLIYIKCYRKKEEKIWAKQESGLITVQLKQDPPVWTLSVQEGDTKLSVENSVCFKG